MRLLVGRHALVQWRVETVSGGVDGWAVGKKDNGCSQNGGDFVPMESPSPGLKSQPLSIPTKLWPKEARTPNIFRNNVKTRRFYKYRKIPIKSEGSAPGNENGTRLAKMIIYPHHAKAPSIRSKNDH